MIISNENVDNEILITETNQKQISRNKSKKKSSIVIKKFDEKEIISDDEDFFKN